MDYKFNISVITAVYNAEKTLEETIECVLNQDIGFKKNLQLILVNDGSIDNSANICKQYANKYPDNILYLEKENGGVSSARNLGMNYIEGKYTIFLDADDIWESNAFSIIADFFDKHYDEVDVCNCRIKYIGTHENKGHPLDFKYNGSNYIIDMLEKPNYINATIGNVVFKSESIKNKRFDKKLSACEDALFQNTLILNKLKVGIISTAIFYYRKEDGLAKTVHKTKDWFLTIPKYFFGELYKQSSEKYGIVQDYCQNCVLYELRWRKYSAYIEFTSDEKTQIIENLSSILNKTDDAILCQSKLPKGYKLYYSMIKYGRDAITNYKFDNGFLKDNNGNAAFSYKTGSIFRISSFAVKDGKFEAFGVTRTGVFGQKPEIFIEYSGCKREIIELKKYPKECVKGFFGEDVLTAYYFKIEIPLVEGMRARFGMNVGDDVFWFKTKWVKDTGLQRENHWWIYRGNHIIEYLKGFIVIHEYNSKNKFLIEAKCLYNLVRTKKGKTLIELLKKQWAQYRLNHRVLVYEQIVNKCVLKDQVAFVTVRSNKKLLDNLQTLYNCVHSKKVIFANRLPLKNRKFKNGLKQIYESKVVVTDDYNLLLRRFGKKEGQFIIQIWHSMGAFKKFGLDGTNMNPYVDWLYHRNYDLVCVSSEDCRKHFATAFAIDIKKIAALGVPRSDNLFDSDYINDRRNNVYKKYPELLGKQIILYAPTFRDVGKGRNIFEPSIDFHALSQSLADNQYFVICPHPVMETVVMNEESDNIKVVKDIPTSEVMLIADMLVTDYSSIIFEYAIFNKPICFYCYDYDEYDRDFYLDYESDLPGPILKNQDELEEFISNYNNYEETNNKLFVQKYLSACDGCSAERIAKIVDSKIR